MQVFADIKLGITWTLLLISSSAGNKVVCQDFINGGLEFGDVTFDGQSMIPYFWENVPASDPLCFASDIGISDTPDLTTETGPYAPNGVMAIPHGGFFSVTGLESNGGLYYHEGIQQSVDSLSIGAEYRISFFQAVVKQGNASQNSGSWIVYKDATEIGLSDSSYSELAYNDINVVWEFREMTFIATASIHTFKFLPWAHHLPAGVRMGIDDIQLDCQVTVDLGIDTSLCSQLEFELDASCPNCTYNWTDGQTSAVRPAHESRLYLVVVDNGCSSASDSIYVERLLCPVVIDMPNVFTPDGNGVNERFLPIEVREIAEWQLTVQSRWGEIVFQTTDLNKGWDGTFEDEKCSPGVYFWTYTGTDSFGSEVDNYGTVHLIRP